MQRHEACPVGLEEMRALEQDNEAFPPRTESRAQRGRPNRQVGDADSGRVGQVEGGLAKTGAGRVHGRRIEMCISAVASGIPRELHQEETDELSRGSIQQVKRGRTSTVDGQARD